MLDIHGEHRTLMAFNVERYAMFANSLANGRSEDGQGLRPPCMQGLWHGPRTLFWIARQKAGNFVLDSVARVGVAQDVLSQCCVAAGTVNGYCRMHIHRYRSAIVCKTDPGLAGLLVGEEVCVRSLQSKLRGDNRGILRAELEGDEGADVAEERRAQALTHLR